MNKTGMRKTRRKLRWKKRFIDLYDCLFRSRYRKAAFFHSDTRSKTAGVSPAVEKIRSNPAELGVPPTSNKVQSKVDHFLLKPSRFPIFHHDTGLDVAKS